MKSTIFRFEPDNYNKDILKIISWFLKRINTVSVRSWKTYKKWAVPNSVPIENYTYNKTLLFVDNWLKNIIQKAYDYPCEDDDYLTISVAVIRSQVIISFDVVSIIDNEKCINDVCNISIWKCNSKYYFMYNEISIPCEINHMS
jgi:hypothetical protein